MYGLVTQSVSLLTKEGFDKNNAFLRGINKCPTHNTVSGTKDWQDNAMKDSQKNLHSLILVQEEVYLYKVRNVLTYQFLKRLCY